jgi:hypothetical protein
VQQFVCSYKNNNEKYVKLIKSTEDKVHDTLSDKKTFIKLAIFSVIESMRYNPEKYSALVYYNNDNQSSILSTSKDNNHNRLNKRSSRQVVLPPPSYYAYIIEDCRAKVLEEAEKLCNVLVDQIVYEVVNKNISKQSTEAIPALTLEGADNKQEHNEQNDTPIKNEQ